MTFDLPAAHYWFSSAAIFVPASFLIGMIVGFFGGKDRMSKKSQSIFWAGAILLALVGWWATAHQERATDEARKETTQLMTAVNKVLERYIGVAPRLAENAPDWLKVAYSELGQTEIIGPAENPRIQAYFKALGDGRNRSDEIDDWASPFVEWSLQQVGKSGPKNMDPFSWLEWGAPTNDPKLGCVVVLSFAGLRHVGFYMGDEGDFIKILGGNQDDSVRVSRYMKSSVVPSGYRCVS